MTVDVDLAWYVYSVLPADGLAPPGDGVLPDVRVEAMRFDALTILASRVPRALFDSTNAANRTADPQWMAARVEGHHAVNVAATEAGPCLPLAFGSLFSSRELLLRWLAPRAGKLRAALEQVAGHEEWAVAMAEDAEAHAAWLEEHDPTLRRLAAAVAGAGEGTAFLMSRRLEKARAAARVADIEAAAATVSKRLADGGFRVLDEALRAGLPSWTVLVSRPATPMHEQADPLPDLALTLAPDLLSAGLSLSLSGPWPAYTFARVALGQDAANG